MTAKFDTTAAVAAYMADVEKSRQIALNHKRKMRNLRIASLTSTFVLGAIAGITGN